MDGLMLLITSCPLHNLAPSSSSYHLLLIQACVLHPHSSYTSLYLRHLLPANCSGGWLCVWWSWLLEVILMGETPDNGGALLPRFVPEPH